MLSIWSVQTALLCCAKAATRVLIITSLSMPGGASARPFTPEDLVRLSRVGHPTISPDGRWLVWQQRETDLRDNRGTFDLWRLDLSRRDAVPTLIASQSDSDETDPTFGPDGALYFLSNRGVGSSRLFKAIGNAVVQISGDDINVAGYKLSPRGDAALIWQDIATQRPKSQQSLVGHPEIRVYDHLMVRHWSQWDDGLRSGLFVIRFDPAARGRMPIALADPALGDVPPKPFGDETQVSWSSDSRTVFFASKRVEGEAASTNMDVFAVPAAGGTVVNMTASNAGTDSMPTASPDGKWLAWAQMSRAGYESDKAVLMVRNLRDGHVRRLTGGWDRSVETIAWARDSKSLYVTAYDQGDVALFRASLSGGRIARLTGPGSVSWVVPAGLGAIYAFDTFVDPTDFWLVDAKGGTRRLTAVNARRLRGIDMPTWTRFSFQGANDDTVHGYALRPQGAAPDAKVPLLVLLHGGPQGSFANGWSYRWNPAIFASRGSGVVTIDFHGSIGYGQSFTDAVHGDWGGKPLVDVQRGLAAAAERFRWLDASRACAAGASYGGYLVNWIAGAWPDRFRCLITHAGQFDLRSFAYTTEELWFPRWDFDGLPYERPAEYERWNPANRVSAWRTPMLVLHGKQDFRVPYTQGLATFTALQQRGVPSRFVLLENEGHWIEKPRASLVWHHAVLDWIAQWTSQARVN